MILACSRSSTECCAIKHCWHGHHHAQHPLLAWQLGCRARSQPLARSSCAVALALSRSWPLTLARSWPLALARSHSLDCFPRCLEHMSDDGDDDDDDGSIQVYYPAIELMNTTKEPHEMKISLALCFSSLRCARRLRVFVTASGCTTALGVRVVLVDHARYR